MISGTTIGPTTAAEKSTFAIGSPVAIDFFEPHMRSAMRSPTSRRMSFPPHQVSARTTATRITEITPTPTSIHPETVLHTPASVALTTETNTTARIVPLSHSPVSFLCRRTQSPVQRWKTCPMMKGSRSRMRMSRMFVQPMEPDAPMSQSTSSGVAIMPMRLETVAAVIAPAMLPRATETNAIEDCTVEGASAIMYGNADAAAEIADQQQVSSLDLRRAGVVRHIIAEFDDDTPRDLARAVAAEVSYWLRELKSRSPRPQ